MNNLMLLSCEEIRISYILSFNFPYGSESKAHVTQTHMKYLIDTQSTNPEGIQHAAEHPLIFATHQRKKIHIYRHCSMCECINFHLKSIQDIQTHIPCQFPIIFVCSLHSTLPDSIYQLRGMQKTYTLNTYQKYQFIVGGHNRVLKKLC